MIDDNTKGIHVKWKNKPMVYKNPFKLIDQKDSTGNSKSFKSDKGSVVISNKLLTITVHQNGEVDIKPNMKAIENAE